MGRHELMHMFARQFPALTVPISPIPQEPDRVAPPALVREVQGTGWYYWGSTWPRWAGKSQGSWTAAQTVQNLCLIPHIVLLPMAEKCPWTCHWDNFQLGGNVPPSILHPPPLPHSLLLFIFYKWAVGHMKGRVPHFLWPAVYACSTWLLPRDMGSIVLSQHRLWFGDIQTC